MSFPQSVKEMVLVSCARHCCICHRFCGIKIELHHIIQEAEGGEDTADNCIPLCFDCHADMRSYDHKHPKGTKYSHAEIRAHRDRWYARVAQTPVAQYSETSSALDREALSSLKSILPWDGAIEFVKSHDFGGTFARARLQPFEDFLFKCRNPEFEFLDAELESLFAALKAAIDDFWANGLELLFPTEHDNELCSIPRDWKHEMRMEAVKRLNASANKVGPAYDALIRAGRRKLGV